MNELPRSIDTAPKDGAPVLLWCEYAGAGYVGYDIPGEWVVAKWQRPGGRAGPYEYWALVQTGGYAEDDHISGEPTHWATLPAPPRG